MFTFIVSSDTIKALAITTMSQKNRQAVPMLTGMYCRHEGDNVTLCTSDKYVLSAYSLPFGGDVSGPDGYGIIPCDLVRYMASARKGARFFVTLEDLTQHTIVGVQPFDSACTEGKTSEYIGYIGDCVKVVKRAREDNTTDCFPLSFNSQLIDALRVGKTLYGNHAISCISEGKEGVYVETYDSSKGKINSNLFQVIGRIASSLRAS